MWRAEHPRGYVCVRARVRVRALIVVAGRAVSRVRRSRTMAENRFTLRRRRAYRTLTDALFGRASVYTRHCACVITRRRSFLVRVQFRFFFFARYFSFSPFLLPLRPTAARHISTRDHV